MAKAGYFDKMFTNYYKWHSNSFNLFVHLLVLPLGLVSVMASMIHIFGVIFYSFVTTVYLAVFASLMSPALCCSSAVAIILLSGISILVAQNFHLIQCMSLSILYFGLQLLGHQLSGQHMFLEAYMRLPNVVDHAVEQFVFRVPLLLKALYITLPKYAMWVMTTRSVVLHRNNTLPEKEPMLRSQKSIMDKQNPVTFVRQKLKSVIPMEEKPNYLESYRVPLSSVCSKLQSIWAQSIEAANEAANLSREESNDKLENAKELEGCTSSSFDQLSEKEKFIHACDEIRFSPSIEKVIRLLFSKRDFALTPVRELDEVLYLRNDFASSDKKALLEFVPYHLDGPSSLFPHSTILSCFVLLDDIKDSKFGRIQSWEGEFREQEKNLTDQAKSLTSPLNEQKTEPQVENLPAGSFALVDYHSGMYRICKESTREAVNARYLKLHYVVHPRAAAWTANLHIRFNRLMSRIPLARQFNYACQQVSGTGPLLAVLAAIICGILTQRPILSCAIIGTYHGLISCAILYCRLLNPGIDFAMVFRDYWFVWYSYLVSLLLLCWNMISLEETSAWFCVILGLFLRFSGVLVLGHVRASFGLEFGACKRKYVSKFPYGSIVGIPHPISLGNLLMLVGLVVPVANQRSWVLISVSAYLVVLEFLQLYLEHNGIFLGAPPHHPTKSVETSKGTRTVNFVEKSHRHSQTN